MATDVLDEHRFTSQCSLYEPTRTRLSKEVKRRPTAGSTATLFETHSSTSAARIRRLRYSAQPQTSVPNTSTHHQSIANRHSVSNDFLSLFRSLAMKPFKTSSMTSGTAEGQTSHAAGGNQIHSKPPVSLLKVRPLSDSITDQTSFTQSTHQIEEFLKRMGWPISSTTDEARAKWKIAMKFLIPVKFDVNRAIELYKTHENTRRIENLDRIWMSNPNLIREIQSNKFFSLPQLPNQPLTVYFNASQLATTASANTLSPHDRELVALQALVCQLDVATESMDVQQTGLNFIYDMQNCSAAQFDMNLSKKILKLLQHGYPAMVKNIFIVSAPKWFKIAYKVSMCTPEQMREFLQNHSNYSLENIPIALGGLYDPAHHGDNRYQICLSTVTNSQSICFPYYSLDSQTKSTSNILFFNPDHHHAHKNQDTTNTTPSSSTTKTTSPQASLVAIVALRRHRDSTSHVRTRKRESSSSSDGEKRKRGSNESLLEEEPPVIASQLPIPQDISLE
ncbi:unnamed protein product [Adineta ricciae]|uniref:CRAL-TRIO domain-containing protein n=1 Tax=Adineta ricciae TaxID=249248 RepID=A0A816BQ30_ADIRI|nr:unnamed protein product [Adineta ricciae]